MQAAKPPRRQFRQETVIHSYITRPLALEIVRLIWNTKLKANHITAIRIILNILAVVCFLMANQVYFLAGFLLFQIHEILDHVDGMYARLKNQTSEIGALAEELFDTVFSEAPNFLGLSIAYAGYAIAHDHSYLYLYVAMSIGSNITLYYKHTFVSPRYLERNEFLQILGLPLKTAVTNLLRTLYVWQNQFLLWGALLYFPVRTYLQIDTLFAGLAVCVILNHLSWIRCAYQGWREATMRNIGEQD